MIVASIRKRVLDLSGKVEVEVEVEGIYDV
jgi:hypothetical protein